jgi:hypothetical protein
LTTTRQTALNWAIEGSSHRWRAGGFRADTVAGY